MAWTGGEAMIVTQWFLVGEEKPTHKGWYECRYIRPYWPGDEYPKYTFPCMRFWNGFQWELDDKALATAFGSDDKDEWRGLAVKPLI